MPPIRWARSKWQVIWHVVIPAAMPEILTGMRIAIGFGWTTLVAAEMIAATAGLGQMVLNASNFLRTDVVIMGIVVIGVFAYVFDLLMRYVEQLDRAVERESLEAGVREGMAMPPRIIVLLLAVSLHRRARATGSPT